MDHPQGVNVDEEWARENWRVGTGRFNFEHLFIAFDDDHGWIVVDRRSDEQAWVTGIEKFNDVFKAVKRHQQMKKASMS